jgi:hypothetical protein
MLTHCTAVGGFEMANAIPFELNGPPTAIDRDTGFTMHHKGYETRNKDMDSTRQFIAPYQIM